VLAQQWVDHALVSDPAAGMVAFADQFDTGRNNRFRQTLLAIVERAFEGNAGQFSPEAIYEYRSRKVKYLLDNGEYEAAATIVDEILAESAPLTASQQIDMLIQRANLEIRRGMLETGIATFDTAIQLSEQQHLTEWQARALNGRGWAFRNQGNYEQALNDYRAAYQLSVFAEDTQRIASISNNMGYVYGILGDRQAAFGYCEDALDMWQTLNYKRYMGSTYSTLGELARRFGEYDKAQGYYDQALQIFKAQEDNEWISIVTTGKGLVYLAQDHTEAARALLEEALPAAPANTVPRILHHLAAIEWRQGNFDAAKQLFEDCRKRSQEAGIHEYNFKGFADLLDIYWEEGAYARWPDLHAELAEIMTRSKSYWLEGSALRKIADLAICNRDYADALQLYQEGVLKIADHTVRNIQTIHRRYTLVDQLEITEARLRRTGLTDSLRQLGHDLSAFWTAHDSLLRDYARALRLLQQWQKG
jgi:tetratricopeptide (TPR) repeat protein